MDGVELDRVVEQVLDARCRPGSLRRLQDEEPSEVRSALVRVLERWHGAATPGVHRRVVGRLGGADIGYEVLIPDGEPPAGGWPVWVHPAHPTEPLEHGADLGSPLGANAAYLVLHGNNAPRPGEHRVSTWGWAERTHELLRRQLADALLHFPLDRDRLVCTGGSASGYACWNLAEDLPGRFAAVWTLGASPLPWRAPFHPNLAYQFGVVVEGEEDQLVPMEMVEREVAAVRALGADVELVRVPGVGHGGYPDEVIDECRSKVAVSRKETMPRELSLGVARRGFDAWWLHVEAPGGWTAPWVGEQFALVLPITASWPDGRVTVEGGRRIELRWTEGDLGPSSGRAGDRVRVIRDGREQEVELQEDPTVALEAACAGGDLARLWAGRVMLGPH